MPPVFLCPWAGRCCHFFPVLRWVTGTWPPSSTHQSPLSCHENLRLAERRGLWGESAMLTRRLQIPAVIIQAAWLKPRTDAKPSSPKSSERTPYLNTLHYRACVCQSGQDFKCCRWAKGPDIFSVMEKKIGLLQIHLYCLSPSDPFFKITFQTINYRFAECISWSLLLFFLLNFDLPRGHDLKRKLVCNPRRTFHSYMQFMSIHALVLF